MVRILPPYAWEIKGVGAVTMYCRMAYGDATVRIVDTHSYRFNSSGKSLNSSTPVLVTR
jgi:hypothetical protein